MRALHVWAGSKGEFGVEDVPGCAAPRLMLIHAQGAPLGHEMDPEGALAVRSKPRWACSFGSGWSPAAVCSTRPLHEQLEKAVEPLRVGFTAAREPQVWLGSWGWGHPWQEIWLDLTQYWQAGISLPPNWPLTGGILPKQVVQTLVMTGTMHVSRNETNSGTTTHLNASMICVNVGLSCGTCAQQLRMSWM